MNPKSKLGHTIAVWVGVFTLCLVLSVIVSIPTELAEAYSRGTCGKTCPALTAEELRLNVIKAYLHHRLEANIERLEFASHEQLVLLPVELTTQSLEQSIKESTLLATLTSNALLLQTHAQIDALAPNTLATYLSIAEYSVSYREATVIPMQSIQPVSLQEVQPHLQAFQASRQLIGRWERLRGYGQHFFRITEYWGLSLACCDDKEDVHGQSPAWLKKNSLQIIQAIRPQVFAVSDRGTILFWKYTGEDVLSYRFGLLTQQATLKGTP